MTGLYLTQLPDILRSGGLTVHEVARWESRARGSGGFANNRLEGMSIHHTAENPLSDGWPSVNYMTLNAPFKPIANLYLDRKGHWWVMAAGATNTSGAGGPWYAIPKDSANSRTLGIEIGNNGRGEPYTVAQQMALLHGVALLWNHFTNRFNWGTQTWRVFGHFEWAPSRKIDPAGPANWTHPTHRYKQWDVNHFRSDLLKHANNLLPTPPPPPPPPPPLPPFDPINGHYGLWPVASKPAIQLNSSGDVVRYLQGVMRNRANQNVAVDGLFGNQTRNAVINIQNFFKINATQGVVEAQTWKYIDFLANPSLDPEPPPPPPPSQPSDAVKDGVYIVRSGDGPWRVSERVYGTGVRYPEIRTANPNTWQMGDRLTIPGIPGRILTVLAGEGPFSIIRRAGQTPNGITLTDFYTFNGGEGYALKENERVFIKT